MKRLWRIIPHDSVRVQSLIQAADLPPVVAQLLVSRGVYSSAAAAEFLDTKLAKLRDPIELPGVPAAVSMIRSAIDAKKPIIVYGDYDCDGMTGTAILVNALRLLGGSASFHVPNRLEDGYGLNEDAIRNLAKHGCQLIISVDCGIASFHHARLCRELGVGLIITDHHTIGNELPEADVIVHPRLPGSAYPFGELCGAGVAFKLAWALCQKANGSQPLSEPMKAFLRQSLALAAIGTIADVVPLVDENRILVEHGLRSLRAVPPVGLAKLMQVTKLDQTSTLSTDSVAFTLAPRLNAAGRLGQAQLGVELLTTTDPARAEALANYIHELNNSRDTLQRSVYIAAQKQIKQDFDPDNDPALVVYGVGWHHGVIGVVAGRLAEKYAKPVIVLSGDTAGRGFATGSGRVGGVDVNLYDALFQCEHHLQRFGGHAAAAGMSIDERKIDAFRFEFCEAVAQQWNEKAIVPEIRIDAEAPLAQINLHLLKQIETLAPFGAGNPRPILCCDGVSLEEPATTMGGGDRHLSVRLNHAGQVVRAVAFGGGGWIDELNAVQGQFEIAYRPVINEWNGYRKVEIHLVDWRLSPKLASTSST
jgi:single-stranded-DNA-specific exonuclease